MDAFPLPGTGEAAVAVSAPGEGVGWWAASPAPLDDDGTFVIAYRVRTGERGRGSNVVARSDDGVRFTTVAELGQERFGAQSMEKPSLVRTDDGRWRLYVCPASPAPSKHWWIDVLDPDDTADFADACAAAGIESQQPRGRAPPGTPRSWPLAVAPRAPGRARRPSHRR